jgi:hypothetical protein
MIDVTDVAKASPLITALITEFSTASSFRDPSFAPPI